MSNTLSSNLEDKIKDYLVDKQKQIDERIESIERDDPILASATMIASSELGTDAWEAEVHAKMVVLKNNLLNLSSDIQHALVKFQHGTYGQCDKCGRHIGAERLEAIPTATVCALCLALTQQI